MTQEALKLALGALEYCWSDSYNTNGYKARELSNKAITAIKEALAQPEQEPVAWLIIHKSTKERFLSTQPNNWNDIDWFKHPLYTTPPQRKPLTDEQIDAEFSKECWVTVTFVDGMQGIALDKTTARDFARAIEAAHGIKV